MNCESVEENKANPDKIPCQWTYLAKFNDGMFFGSCTLIQGYSVQYIRGPVALDEAESGQL